MVRYYGDHERISDLLMSVKIDREFHQVVSGSGIERKGRFSPTTSVRLGASDAGYPNKDLMNRIIDEIDAEYPDSVVADGAASDGTGEVSQSDDTQN